MKNIWLLLLLLVLPTAESLASARKRGRGDKAPKTSASAGGDEYTDEQKDALKEKRFCELCKQIIWSEWDMPEHTRKCLLKIAKKASTTKAENPAHKKRALTPSKDDSEEEEEEEEEEETPPPLAVKKKDFKIANQKKPFYNLSSHNFDCLICGDFSAPLKYVVKKHIKKEHPIICPYCAEELGNEKLSVHLAGMANFSCLQKSLGITEAADTGALEVADSEEEEEEETPPPLAVKKTALLRQMANPEKATCPHCRKEIFNVLLPKHKRHCLKRQQKHSKSASAAAGTTTTTHITLPQPTSDYAPASASGVAAPAGNVVPLPVPPSASAGGSSQAPAIEPVSHGGVAADIPVNADEEDGHLFDYFGQGDLLDDDFFSRKRPPGVGNGGASNHLLDAQCQLCSKQFKNYFDSGLAICSDCIMADTLPAAQPAHPLLAEEQEKPAKPLGGRGAGTQNAAASAIYDPATGAGGSAWQGGASDHLATAPEENFQCYGCFEEFESSEALLVHINHVDYAHYDKHINKYKERDNQRLSALADAAMKEGSSEEDDEDEDNASGSDQEDISASESPSEADDASSVESEWKKPRKKCSQRKSQRTRKTAQPRPVKKAPLTKNDVGEFVCPYCTVYTTINIHNMQRHIWKHTGEKPYKCSNCEYRTRIKQVLDDHEAIHSNIKPFTCSMCNFKAIQKSNLKRHNSSHDESRRRFDHYCSKCSFGSNSKFIVTTHEHKMHDSDGKT